ncbi:lytic polysaccharide monooxygenase, partial [Scytalidium lignicola]
MKFTISLLALAVGAQAHYTFPALIYSGTTTTPWEYVRQWVGYYTYDPVTDVTSDDIRCNVDPAFASGTLSVTAGSVLGFTVDPDIYHPGPLLAYMAKVPSGYTAQNWDGTGTYWFKIFEQGPGGLGTQALTWPSNGDTTVSFTIPESTPNGDYLFRVEQIALHVAQSVGGAQFYLSCGQITVTGGGSGTPGPLVAFPGAYSPTDPGILIDIYYPVPTNYTPPGPPVWSG